MRGLRCSSSWGAIVFLSSPLGVKQRWSRPTLLDPRPSAGRRQAHPSEYRSQDSEDVSTGSGLPNEDMADVKPFRRRRQHCDHATSHWSSRDEPRGDRRAPRDMPVVKIEPRLPGSNPASRLSRSLQPPARLEGLIFRRPKTVAPGLGVDYSGTSGRRRLRDPDAELGENGPLLSAGDIPRYMPGWYVHWSDVLATAGGPAVHGLMFKLPTPCLWPKATRCPASVEEQLLRLHDMAGNLGGRPRNGGPRWRGSSCRWRRHRDSSRSERPSSGRVAAHDARHNPTCRT
jgi:hypothetical protein